MVAIDTSWLTPRALAPPSSAFETGRYAAERIRAGETVVAFGGLCADRAALVMLPDDRRRRAIQIDDDLFLVSGETGDDGDAISHSCSPNCGLSGQILLVAMRDIAAGEELTYDYATSESSAYDEFECHCGSLLCRHKVTANDWMLPEVQQAYRGWFSPYLARRIAGLTSLDCHRRVFAYS